MMQRPIVLLQMKLNHKNRSGSSLCLNFLCKYSAHAWLTFVFCRMKTSGQCPDYLVCAERSGEKSWDTP